MIELCAGLPASQKEYKHCARGGEKKMFEPVIAQITPLGWGIIFGEIFTIIGDLVLGLVSIFAVI
jgi:hypothetical protein